MTSKRRWKLRLTAQPAANRPGAIWVWPPWSENDPGRLDGWLRAGRTLKTPTFTLNSGYVHYLIEGVGHVYAAVDSHAMINGPLHAELLKETGGNSDLPTRWITHDLSRYVGERVHLEFTPKEDEDFRVLMVVEGQKRPAAPVMRSQSTACRPRSQQTDQLRPLAGSLSSRRSICWPGIVSPPIRSRQIEPRWRTGSSHMRKPMLVSAGELARLASAYSAAREKIAERSSQPSRASAWRCGTARRWMRTCSFAAIIKRSGPVVPRRIAGSVSGTQKQKARIGRRSDRLDLARQLVDRSNPLVSRVIVNRVWQHLMGRGIVPSVDNFGVLGERPTHPELLDYLADEFMRDGWSLKRLIRRIMLSSTYKWAGRSERQSVQRSGRSGRSAEPAVSSAESEAAGRRERFAMRSWPSRAGWIASMYRAERAGSSHALHARPRPAERQRAARWRRPAEHLHRRPPQFPLADDARLRHADSVHHDRPPQREQRAGAGPDLDERSVRRPSRRGSGPASCWPEANPPHRATVFARCTWRPLAASRVGSETGSRAGVHRAAEAKVGFG